jgi:pimeloyl-ACP methyl ester carboxylesterase
VSSPARLRRAYFDCRYGQLHVHQAIPPGGGFDEAAPLLCIAGSEGTGRVFYPVLGALGKDRTIYAPDLPGCGESDSAGAGAGTEQYALAFTDLLDSLRQRQVDVLAYAQGAETAIAIERLRPHALVRRMVLSRPSPGAVQAAQALRILFRELAPAGFSPDATGAAPENLQLTELIEFFGSASHA